MDILRKLNFESNHKYFSSQHNISPLHVAAKWGKNNMVKILLENSASIDAKTRDGLTPLHCAARSGHEEVVSTLLEHEAPISARTKVIFFIHDQKKHARSPEDHYFLKILMRFFGKIGDWETIRGVTFVQRLKKRGNCFFNES